MVARGEEMKEYFLKRKFSIPCLIKHKWVIDHRTTAMTEYKYCKRCGAVKITQINFNGMPQVIDFSIFYEVKK
jgi:hypothetical protein